MPTPIGILFLLVSLYFFFRKDESLFGLVLFSSLFHASSIIDAENHGVEPYYLVALLFVLQNVFRRRHFLSNHFRGKNWMLAFTGLACVSAVALPILFQGTPVYDPYVGIDDGLLLRMPLHLSLANFTQSAYLILGVLVVLAASQIEPNSKEVNQAVKITFLFFIGIITIQFLCTTVGVHFPYEILQNHGGYDVQDMQGGGADTRYPGTFTESSGAGLVLATLTSGFLAQKIQGNKGLVFCMMGFFAILLVRSSASLAAMAIVVLSLLVANPIYHFPFRIDLRMLKRSSLLLGIVALAGILAVASPLKDSLVSQTAGKSESSSYINRTISDVYALSLAIQTKGLGVGMGSNRPSSLIPSLLSTVGVLGTVLFIGLVIRILSNARGEQAWIRWAGFAAFIDLGLGGPDFVSPWIWVVLALGAQAAAAVTPPQRIALQE